MSQFSFISWSYKNIFSSILPHSPLYLITVQAYEVHFPKPADMWLIQTQ